MSISTFMEDFEDWCGTRHPGQPPRPHWLEEALAAVVISELSARVHGDAAQELESVTLRMFSRAGDSFDRPQPQPWLVRDNR